MSSPKVKSPGKQRIPLTVTADQLFNHKIPEEMKNGSFHIQTLQDPKLRPRHPVPMARVSSRSIQGSKKKQTATTSPRERNLNVIIAASSATHTHPSSPQGSANSATIRFPQYGATFRENILEVTGTKKAKFEREVDVLR